METDAEFMNFRLQTYQLDCGQKSQIGMMMNVIECKLTAAMAECAEPTETGAQYEKTVGLRQCPPQNTRLASIALHMF